MFCKNCGQQLLEDSKFCHKCGTPVNENNANDTTQRKQSYVGEVKKCPSCGMELSSMTAICPACGHEINSAVVYPALADFIDSLNSCNCKIADEEQKNREISNWNSWEFTTKLLWIILNIITFCVPLVVYLSIKSYFKNNSHITPFGKEKVNLIENFQIPNEREAIIETLYFIQTKINSLSVQKVTNDNWFWIKLWYVKASQIYQKSTIMLPGEKIVENTYLDIDNKTKNVRQIVKIKFIAKIMLIIFYALFIGFSVVFILKNSINLPFNPSYIWILALPLVLVFIMLISKSDGIISKFGELIAKNAGVLFGIISYIMAIRTYNQDENGSMYELIGVILLISSASILLKRNATYIEIFIVTLGGIVLFYFANLLDNGSMAQLGGAVTLLITAVSFFKKSIKKDK